MRGLQSFACYGGVGAIELGVRAGFFDQSKHGIGQRTGVSGAAPGLVIRIGYLA